MLASLVGTAEENVITRRFDYTKCPLYIFSFYLRYGRHQPSTKRVRPYSWSMQETSSKVRVWRVWALSSIRLDAKFTVPSPSKDFFARKWQMTKRGSKKRFSFRLRNMGVPFCILFVDAVWPVLIKRPSRNLRCVLWRVHDGRNRSVRVAKPLSIGY